uniref:Uncharacterized protein n=1 Tax=Anguilla anguilla TaxID=7936 RepID=A0A0E9Q3E7_ANGAN
MKIISSSGRETTEKLST